MFFNRYRLRLLLLIAPGLFLFTGACKRIPELSADAPNIILIMVDDLGVECLGAYGSLAYQTPRLDSLAAKGLLFENCMSQPLCTPSRLKIMTGLYNYRNYERDGYLPSDQVTFGNLLQEVGYQTCIAGKWQLNGIRDKEEYPDWNNTERPHQFGFNEYCLYRLTQGGSRYANPLIEQNGTTLNTAEDDYGPDIFTNFILDFIERNREAPFFVYYPMTLVHQPFSPTPDSPAWQNPQRREERDTAYFGDMVTYTDKLVGRIVDKLIELNLDERTLVIFTGDNGTPRDIYTLTTQGVVQGGKGLPTAGGTHTPLIAWWPGTIIPGRRHSELVEFSDFYPTFAELAGLTVQVDGKSFAPLLLDSTYTPRATAFLHFVPKARVGPEDYRHQFVRSLNYKLYRDGEFYNLRTDPLEMNPLSPDSLNVEQQAALDALQAELQKHPG